MSNSSDPIYVNVLTATIPSNTYKTGWPQRLKDEAGTEYWRLRDGYPYPGQSYSGDDVLYGRIVRYDEAEGLPVVSKEYQYMIDPSTLPKPPAPPKTTRLLLLATPWAGSDVLPTDLDDDTFLTDPPS